MSINLVDLVKNQLGGSTLGKLSSFLGESTDRTQTAVDAAVPTLLAGLSHVSSTPEGAQKLFSAVSGHDTSTADNFSSAVSAQGGEALAEKGSSALSSLFGGGMLSNVTSVLGRFSGLKGNGAASLIGMLAPLIFGLLSRHQNSTGLDAAGLSSFLGEQKGNIAAAMPPGLGSMLGSIPGLGSFARKAEPEAAFAERSAYQRPEIDTRTTAKPAHAGAGAGGGKWALGLVAVLVAVGLLWSFSHRRAERDQAGATMTEPAGAQAPTAKTLTSDLRETLNGANSTLSGITDATSADKAIPQINELNGKLSDMHQSWNKLPDAAKPAVASSVQGMTGKLKDSIAKIRDIPGASDKLKPALDELESHLSSFSENP